MKTILFLLLLPVCVNAQIITTVAGNGSRNGDGGPATIAGLYYPEGITIDHSGNIFIADVNNNCIRKVNTSGIITSIAGNGIAAYSGDGGEATACELNYPTGVATDSLGNVYIADASNNRVRKVDTHGIITTIAGGGTGGLGDGGMATAAELNRPYALAIDHVNNIYIVDEGNHRIRMVNRSGIIITIAGTGSIGHLGDGGPATAATFFFPRGIAVDDSGTIYIADSDNSLIRKVNALGIITTIAGGGTSGLGDGGPATAAVLYGPTGMALDHAGNLYFADISNNRVRKVDREGIINTIAGDGIMGHTGDGAAAIAAQANSPIAVAVDSMGNIYFTEVMFIGDVRKVDTSGLISTPIGGSSFYYIGDGAPATAGQLYNPTGVAVDDSGNFYIADENNNRIRKVTPAGILSTIGGNDSIGYAGDGGSATAAFLNYPTDVAVDHRGNIYVADEINNVIRKITPGGIISTYAGNGHQAGMYFGEFSGDGGPATAAGFFFPQSIALDDAGDLFIADSWNNCIRKVDALGIISTIAGNNLPGYSGDGGPADSAQLDDPSGVAVDKYGNVYIADALNNRVRKVDTAGIITTIAGNGIYGYSGDGGAATAAELYEPIGVAADGNGNVYIADWKSDRIRMIDAYGIINTIAGDGDGSPANGGYGGDGGMGTAAQLYFPCDVALDHAGNLYIADEGNNRVRKLTPGTSVIKSVIIPNEAISVYPNPATTEITVVCAGKISSIAISTLWGQTIFDRHYSSTEAKINIAALPPGIYFICVNNTAVRKVIKQ